MSMRIKIMSYVSVALLFGCVSLANAEDTAASPDAKPAPSPMPKMKRILEPESAVQFTIDEVWKQKYSEDSTTFTRDGGAAGTLIVRFPPNFKSQPQSAESLRDDDLKNAKNKPEWKKEHRRSVDVTWEVPALPDGLVAISNGFESARDKKTFLVRNFYITSPIKGIVAVSCELPIEAVSADDVCMTVMKTTKILSAEDRQRRLAAGEMMTRLSNDSEKEDVLCSKINDENKEFRSFYPTAKIEEAPRFKKLNTLMLALYFKDFSKVPPNKLKEYLALIKEIPVLLKTLEAECQSNPQESYADAVKVVFKSSKSESK
jgi:hypothetical protein